MGARTRVRSLLAPASRGGKIASLVLALVLVAGGLTGGVVWWHWPERTPETTSAPPPVPLADQPPEMPTELLWQAPSGTDVVVTPGGYVVLAGETVAVRDLFTGELRWEFAHPEPASAAVRLHSDDQMIVQFGRSSWRSNPQRAFHIPSGEQLPLDEARGAIMAANSGDDPPNLPEAACGPGLDDAPAAAAGIWVYLLDCAEHTQAVGVETTGQVRFQVELPVAAADFAEVTVVATGYGLAVVQASERVLDRTSDQLFGVDLATGAVTPPVPVGDHFFGSLRPQDIVAVPDGFCAWDGLGDLSVSCYDGTSGEERWHRYQDPVSANRAPAAVVLADETLLLMTDARPSRWVGYRLADGEPQFDLDRVIPVEPQVAHYDDGVLAITGHNGIHRTAIVVFGDAGAG